MIPITRTKSIDVMDIPDLALGMMFYMWHDFIFRSHPGEILWDFDNPDNNPGDRDLITLNFYSQDTEDLFNQRISDNTMPQYYRDKPIHYTMTPESLRNEIELSEYLKTDQDILLSMGDSQTFGVGNYNEDLYHQIISQNTDMLNLNFGIPGSSLEFVLQNSIGLKKLGLKPKVVIVQHTQIFRTPIVLKNKENFILGMQDFEWQDLSNKVAQNDFTVYLQKAQIAHAITELWDSVGVPVIHITFGNDGTNRLFNEIKNFDMQEMLNRDIPALARDFAHDGPAVHREAADWIIKNLKEQYL